MIRGDFFLFILHILSDVIKFILIIQRYNEELQHQI